MTAASPFTRAELGTIGSIRCSVAITRVPWQLPIDTIVVSVGTGLGRLGLAVREVFPNAEWTTTPFPNGPASPRYLRLSRPSGVVTTLRQAILANPHGGDGARTVTEETVTLATTQAIRLAVDNGARWLAVPLLGTGALAFPARQIAATVVPEVVDLLRSVPEGSLDSFDFLCEDTATAELIAADFSVTVRSGSFDWSESTEAPLPEPAQKAPTTRVAANTPTPAPPTAEDRYSTDELAGGVSSDHVDPSVGIPLHRDQLGVAPYVSMLATVMADRRTPLPLSVGIFGEWGSGKSYFMGLLRERISTLAGSDSTRYCDEIVQIGFNAWHYVDSNLWASLGDEIFRQLAGPEATGEPNVKQIHTELAKRLDQREQLELATEQARATAAELEAEVDRAIARRETAGRTLVDAMRRSQALGDRMDALWRRLGVSGEVEQGKLFLAQMRGAHGEAEAVGALPSGRRGRVALAVAVVALIATSVALLVPHVREWVAAVFGVVTLCTGGAGYTYLNRARQGLTELRQVTEEVRSGISASVEEDPEIRAGLEQLRAAEAEHLVARAQLDEVIAKVGELGAQLTRLTPGRRLYTFLAERARSDSYTSNLGLTSTIRKDFQQLVTLMQEWRDDPTGWDGSRRPVERIVLYIDDLDRCRPDQVVEVLQAVHLLLAFELFVVVVGVDPRWLLNSLRSQYADLLHDSLREDPHDGSHTPEDYLEKILNIPLTLPTMGAGGLERLLRSLDDGARPILVPRESGEAPPPRRSPPLQHVPFDAAAITIEQGSELDARRSPGAEPRPLTEAEITLLAAMDLLIDTPREAKRLINLYRMIRATRDLSAASHFLGSDESPGEYQAVVLLLALLTAHARLLAAVLDTRPEPTDGIDGGIAHRAPGTPWSDFVADLEPRRTDAGWSTRISGAFPDDQLAHWIRLHDGMLRLSTLITLPDLALLQSWLPRIRRFSYVLTTESTTSARHR